MMKNDYRRALIMLRPHRQGYSGHVRLERRTLMGSMYFVISVPAGSGELCAALIRRDREGTYFSTKIGVLRRDGRGQASLAYTFDPRNIDGYALEDYILIAITERDPENCNLVLTGNVNGAQEVSLNNVRIAACEACGEGRQPACDLRPQPRMGEAIRPSLPTIESPMEQPDEPTTNDSGEQCAEWPDEERQTQPTLVEPERGDVSAAVTLQIDVSQPWPGASEQVRGLFAKQPVQELMLGDGYTYVRGPMPQGSGYEYVNVGVKLKDGRPESIAYALPARYAPEPPAGLDGYVWKGGASEGWWTLQTDAETGEPLA